MQPGGHPYVPRRGGGRDDELLRQAQQLYERGLSSGWEWQQSTKQADSRLKPWTDRPACCALPLTRKRPRRGRRWLLRICAARGQMPYALRMVSEMEARGEELFAPLNDLVHACHRVDQVDNEALRLWEEGGAVHAAQRLPDEPWTEPHVAAGAHDSPPLLAHAARPSDKPIQ